MVIFGVTQSTDTNPKVHIFPVQFKTPPLVQYSATCYNLTSSTYIGYVDSITNNSFRFVVRDIKDGPKNEGVTYIATGKWK